MLKKSLAALVLIAACSQTALAADWQYCLAPSQAEHKIYVTGAFPVRGALSDAIDAFEQALDEAGLHHDVVQCPRADDKHSIVMMEQYAISINQKMGNKIIRVAIEQPR
jgi:ABC-type glycerol-3-phosphate transport system substrate-binding protein